MHTNDVTPVLTPIAAVQAAKPHLPKLVLSVFKGDVTHWTSF